MTYQADSWTRARRAIVKVEVTAKGINNRFVVITRVRIRLASSHPSESLWLAPVSNPGWIPVINSG